MKLEKNRLACLQVRQIYCGWRGGLGHPERSEGFREFTTARCLQGGLATPLSKHLKRYNVLELRILNIDSRGIQKTANYPRRQRRTLPLGCVALLLVSLAVLLLKRLPADLALAGARDLDLSL